MNRGLILSREVNVLILTPKHWHILTAISCGFAVRILRFFGLKVWMLRGLVFTRSLLGKVLELSWRRCRTGVEPPRHLRLIGENSLA